MSQINLLPDDYVARRRQKRSNRLCGVLLAMVMIAVLAAAVVSEQGYRRTREVSQRIDESYDQAGKLIEQLQSLETVRAKMLQKAKVTAALLEKVPRSYLLASITNALPQGASLTKLEMTSARDRTVTISRDGRSSSNQVSSEGGGAPGSDVEVRITLTGLAGTDVEVGKFIAGMDKNPLMETVDLVYSQEKTVPQYQVGAPDKQTGEHVAREFQVVMKLKNDADVRVLTEVEDPKRDESRLEPHAAMSVGIPKRDRSRLGSPPLGMGEGLPGGIPQKPAGEVQ